MRSNSSKPRPSKDLFSPSRSIRRARTGSGERRVSRAEILEGGLDGGFAGEERNAVDAAAGD